MEREQLAKMISINSWSIAIQLVTLVAVISGVVAITQELRTSSGDRVAAPIQAMTASEVDNWGQYARAHNAQIGASGAAVTVLEFTDFQCPYCKTFSETARADLLEKYDGKIQFIVKNFPLEATHPAAKIAAIAAQCAHRNGRYWEMERALFANAQKLNEEFVGALGASMKLGSEFGTCVTKGETLAEVEQDLLDGQSVGVRGTPTFVVNGRVSVGTLSQTVIDDALQEAESL